jgi:hypothetical protein
MVNIVCPDCGRRIGNVEESEGGLVAKARVGSSPRKEVLGAPAVREHKANVGHIPSTDNWVTVPAVGPIPVAFICPEHGYFELPDAELRDAVSRARTGHKRIRLPAQRPQGTGHVDVSAHRQ